MMADLVESVLAAAVEKESKFKPTTVQKLVDPDIDEGNLLICDNDPIEPRKFREDSEKFLKNLARDNTQLLLNRLWELPTEHVDDVVIVKLPAPKTILPREKPVPKAMAPTKWEEFTRLKGIQKRKKEKKVWDEALKEWKPRYGYKRGNDPLKQWVLEVPQNADPYEDQFEKITKQKKERIAKNELHRLRNIARNMKGKIPGVGILPTPNPDKEQVTRALHEAKRSTASVGKFTDSLPKEKPAKGMGKKRKFQSNIGDFGGEKKKALEILGKVYSQKPIVNASHAANQQILSEETQRSKQAAKGTKQKSQGRSRKGLIQKSQGRKGFNTGKKKTGGGKRSKAK